MVAESGGRPPPKRRAPAKRRRPGEGSVYRRGSRWTAMVDLGYVTGPDGKRRRRRVTVTADTAEEAARELRLLRGRADVGMVIPDGKTSVADFLRAWLDTKAGGVRSSTLDSYRQHAAGHLVPFLGHHRLSKLTPLHVENLIASMVTAGLATATIRSVIITLSSALKAAVAWGMVPSNAAALAHLPKRQNYQPHPLSMDEAHRLLDQFTGDHYEALFWTMVGTGLRIGEALALRWADIDLDAGRLSVRYSLLRVKAGSKITGVDNDMVRLTETAALVPPKTASSRATLSLPAVVADHLRRHKDSQDAARLAAGPKWRDFGLVFTNPVVSRVGRGGRHSKAGTPVDYNALLKRYRVALEAAGLPQIRLHDLRHTCAVLLIEGGGANLKQVQRQMRHARIETTLDVYGHVTDELQARAAEEMDGLLGKPKQSPLE